MGWHLCKLQLAVALGNVERLERELREARQEIEALEDENARILAACEASRVRIETAIAEIEAIL